MNYVDIIRACYMYIFYVFVINYIKTLLGVTSKFRWVQLRGNITFLILSHYKKYNIWYVSSFNTMIYAYLNE